MFWSAPNLLNAWCTCGLLAGMKNGPGSILWVDYDDGGGGHEPRVISTTVRGGHPHTGKILM